MDVVLSCLLVLVTIGYAIDGADAAGVRRAREHFVCARFSRQAGLCKIDPVTGIGYAGVYKGVPGVLYTNSVYLHGNFMVRLKLPRGYAGGVNFAFYLIDPLYKDNHDPRHQEIDVEIYGGAKNSNFYTTNIFAGSQKYLAQFNLNIDTSSQFHNYSIQWNPKFIAWSVDGVPYRILYRSNHPWPTRPLQLQMSVWDCSSYCSLKPDYSRGPITMQIGGFSIEGCHYKTAFVSMSGCPSDTSKSWMAALSVDQLRAYRRAYGNSLANDYGWRKN